MATKKITKKQDDEQLAVISGIEDMLMSDAGAGQEEMGGEDFAIPRLTILQALSPQVQKRGEDYVPGAEAGMIFSTLDSSLIDGEAGIIVIPVSYRKTYMEWKLREDGGGLVKDWGNDASILSKTTKDSKGRDMTPSGTQITPTAEYYVLRYDEETGQAQPALLSLSSTQLKYSRRWNTMINTLRVKLPNGQTINPAMFYQAYRLTTIPESNDKGSWFSWGIKSEKPTVELENGKDIYIAAREFRESVKSGDVKVAEPVAETTDDEAF